MSRYRALMAKQPGNFTDKNSEDGLLERYLGEISSYAPLTDEEERELSARALAGDADAREALAKANLKFVVSIARQYAADGVSMLDLVNEGNMALLSAAGKFDASRGQRFSSYAVWSVRKAMRDFLPDAGVRVKGADMDSQHFGGSSDESPETSAEGEEYAGILSQLPPRERLVVGSCFGIGRRQMTMREIGEQYGMTRERVRQIRKRALRRLKKGGKA